LVEFRDWVGASWPPAEAFMHSVEILLRQPDTVFLLGSRSGDARPAGVCQLRFRLSVWTATEDCWLEDLYIREPQRGTGLGRALLDAACGQARRRGCRRIELDVNEVNDHAVRLYRAAGFSPHSKGMSTTGRDILMGLTLTTGAAGRERDRSDGGDEDVDIDDRPQV
jgi:GNAT superfamily N-acetyltransferase